MSRPFDTWSLKTANNQHSGGSDDAVEVTDAIWGLLAIVAKQGLTNIRAIVASTFGTQGHKQSGIHELKVCASAASRTWPCLFSGGDPG